jgi:hypothetical protein
LTDIKPAGTLKLISFLIQIPDIKRIARSRISIVEQKFCVGQKLYDIAQLVCGWSFATLPLLLVV